MGTFKAFLREMDKTLKITVCSLLAEAQVTTAVFAEDPSAAWEARLKAFASRRGSLEGQRG